MITGIEIRSEVVPSDDPVQSPLNVNHLLRRDSALEPSSDGLRRDAQLAGELGLAPVPERGNCAPENNSGTWNSIRELDSGISHNCKVIHGRFIPVNDRVIAHTPAADEHEPMSNASIPQPENYASFAAWVRALVHQVGGNQAALCRAVGIKPQMLTRYLSNGAPTTENLQKFADYSGVSYAKLRLLIDGKPLSEAKTIKDRVNQTATPAGAQIGRQWEIIQDERTRALIAEQIKIALEHQARLDVATRKRTG